jgi:hypothetical protein
VRPPRGEFWSAGTIHGNRARGSGLLSNALYDGRLVWNKVTLRKDPRTGKRVSRVNPESEWQTTAVPHLRIVEAETFAAAQARMEERGHLKTPAARRKPRHLLSGLLRCGCCGGALVAKDRDAKGRRVYCSRMREGGACTNGRAFYLDDIELRVLAGLEAQLNDPRAIERFLKTYAEERKRLAAAEEAKRHRKETRLGEVQREFQRVYNSYVKGMVSEEETGPLLAQLREEREALKAELAAMTPPANVVTLHPGAVKRYLAMVNDLATSLPHRTVSGDEGISIALRDLVSCVTITPTSDKGPPKISVTGRLAVLVGGDLFPHSRGDIGGSGGGICTPDTRIKIEWHERSMPFAGFERSFRCFRPQRHTAIVGSCITKFRGDTAPERKLAEQIPVVQLYCTRRLLARLRGSQDMAHAGQPYARRAEMTSKAHWRFLCPRLAGWIVEVHIEPNKRVGLLMALSACLHCSADGLSLRSSIAIRNAPKASAQAEHIQRYAPATRPVNKKFLEAFDAKARLAEWPRSCFSSRYRTTPSICSTTRGSRLDRVVLAGQSAWGPEVPGRSGRPLSRMIGPSASTSAMQSSTCSKRGSATCWTTCSIPESRIARGNLA